MPKRVLFVVPDLAVGGAERHLVALAAALDPSRCEASVVCIGEQGAFFGELRAAGIPCRALHHGKADAARALVDLYRLIRRDGPDAVVVRGYSAEVLGRIAARMTGTPAMVWVHDASEVVRRTRVRRAADRWLTPGSTAVIGLVEAQRPHLASLGWRDDQVVLVPPGVDPLPVTRSGAAVRAEFGLSPDAELVVAVARHDPQKDLSTLLRAVARLRPLRPRVRLLLAGDGKSRGDLERLAEGLGLDDVVVFAGRRGDVGDLLAAADVAALSSVSECAPQAILEAMVAGVAVVATAVGGVPELVVHGETGVLVPPSDPAALAAGLSELLGDPERRETFGRAARLRVERFFRWRVVGPRVETALLARLGSATDHP